MISNLKRFLLGTFHGAVRPHRLQEYLDESVYRVNRPTLLPVEFRDVKRKSGDRKLTGKGRKAPSKTTLEILDADTGRVLGSVKTEGDGKFEIELKLPSAPCQIQARLAGKTSSPHPVHGVRRGDERADNEGGDRDDD